ncbi:MAG: N-6 DNA methylase [Erysipelotrichaceae bacterium]|nr:N-6 DNA methylase [Erysipelotrichaceae bacterium]
MRRIIYKSQFSTEIGDVLQKELTDRYDVSFAQPPFNLRTFVPSIKDKDSSFEYKENEKTIRADWHYKIKALDSTNKEGKTFVAIPEGIIYNTPDSFYSKQIIDKKRLEAVEYSAKSGPLCPILGATCSA